MNRTALIAASVVALIGFALLTLYVRRFRREVMGGDPVEVLVLRQDLPAGSRVREEALASRLIPDAYVEPRHIRASERSRVLGVRVSLELFANQALLWTDLETTERENLSLSTRVPRGMRAMMIEGVRGNVFEGLLRPGNRVDVLLTKVKPGTEPRTVTVPLLQNLLVLAVGDDVRPAYEEVSERTESNAVTLLVSLDQAALLAQAQRDGTFRLVLRNDDDVDVQEQIGETDDSYLLEQDKRARLQAARRIERVR
jgi:pilus assembly protein CpaB